MGDIPGPDQCVSELDIKKKIIDKIPAKHRDFFLRERPIEMRNLPGESMFDEPKNKLHYKHVWMKAAGKLPDEV